MPTYEYECQNCGHRLEAFQSMTDDPLKKCPECGKDTLKRLIGLGGGIIFKGSGFYETDYKRASSPKKDTTNASDGSNSSQNKKEGTNDSKSSTES